MNAIRSRGKLIVFLTWGTIWIGLIIMRMEHGSHRVTSRLALAYPAYPNSQTPFDIGALTPSHDFSSCSSVQALRAPNDRLTFSLSNITESVTAWLWGHVWMYTRDITAQLLCRRSLGWVTPSHSQCVRGAFGFTRLEKEEGGEHSFCNVQDDQVGFYFVMVTIASL